MHALIEDGAVKQYPYNIAQLKQANPNSSFPKNPSDALLAEFGVQRVFFSTQPETTDVQVLEEQPPVFDAEAQRWAQVWSVRNMTADEIAARNDAQAARVRGERNDKLAASDWMALSDNIMTTEWSSYRQKLRDITIQSEFPWNVVWPESGQKNLSVISN